MNLFFIEGEDDGAKPLRDYNYCMVSSPSVRRWWLSLVKRRIGIKMFNIFDSPTNILINAHYIFKFEITI